MAACPSPAGFSSILLLGRGEISHCRAELTADSRFALLQALRAAFAPRNSASADAVRTISRHSVFVLRCGGFAAIAFDGNLVEALGF